MHHVALVTDVSQMYRAVKLVELDQDLHRFVWRRSPDESLQDYRMTRITFGVSASSFAANMSVKGQKILLTVLPEDCSPLNSWSIHCGGTTLNGFDQNPPIGQKSHVVTRLNLQVRKRRSVSTQQSSRGTPLWLSPLFILQ